MNVKKLFIVVVVSDDEEDVWPEDITGEPRNKTHIPQNNGDAISMRGAKKSESVLYNMAVILASVAAGFDIRLSKTTAIHPDVLGASGEEKPPAKRDSFILNRRDAYFSAVRDSLIEPEGDFKNYPFTSTSGYHHHTYHGVQARHRPSAYFEGVPMRFTEQTELNHAFTGEGHVGSSSNSTSPRRSTESESPLISLSPSQDKSFMFQRQMSESSAYDTVKPSAKLTPQRHSVTFEDDFNPVRQAYNCHKRTPSNTSNCSGLAFESDPWSRSETSSITSGQPPIPPRRYYSSPEQAERPKTLNVGPRQRHIAPTSILKNASPTPTTHFSRDTARPSTGTPTPDSVVENTHYFSARSRPSPGSTPPHIAHHKTLLDIDVEGQSQDSTQPLVRPDPSQVSRTTFSHFDRDFLH